MSICIPPRYDMVLVGFSKQLHTLPQHARGLFPNDIKTKLVMTCNLRSWRHIFRLRTSIAETGAPHPDMIRLMNPLLKWFKEHYNIFFFDLEIK